MNKNQLLPEQNKIAKKNNKKLSSRQNIINFDRDH